jgi:hypothetical protein
LGTQQYEASDREQERTHCRGVYRSGSCIVFTKLILNRERMRASAPLKDSYGSLGSHLPKAGGTISLLRLD